MIDVWSVMHGYVGTIYGVAELPWQTALLLAVLWEVVENPLKDRFPLAFPDAKHDSYPNAIGDVAAAMLGWWVGSKL